MRAKDSLDKSPVVLEPERKKEVVIAPEEMRTEPREAGRSLAVMFLYNGHDFEAHSVLGVPQGSSMHQVTLKYQDLVKSSDARSLQLYEHAYSAIAVRHRSHRL
jgi:hypothetical protein